MDKQKRYPPEVRERAVRMVLDHAKEHGGQVGNDLLDCRQAGHDRGDAAALGQSQRFVSDTRYKETNRATSHQYSGSQ